MNFSFKKTRAKSDSSNQPSINNFHCSDSTLEFDVHSYLKGLFTPLRCTQAILQHLAYGVGLQMNENRVILDFCANILSSAIWKDERDMECGDYDPARHNQYLKCIYQPYERMIEYIYQAMRYNEETNKPLTTEALQETLKFWKENISADFIENFEENEEKYETLRNYIDKGDFSPFEGILMLQKHWDIIPETQYKYEAIEYLFACSLNHNFGLSFDVEVRDLAIKLSNIFESKKEKK